MANDPVNSHIAPVNHNPDVLSCLANLSNDEVFTPPPVANNMLDMLPQELFTSPDTKFLDPACKSGVFLREITKRLMNGLEEEFPDLQKRLDHILHHQVYGIAITELTSLLSRRTLYCAKYPNCHFSISHFDNISGNIRHKAIQHTWKNGKCVFCGASQSQYERAEGLETHAYEFIHTDKPQETFGDMKFDVIIGNPPYQLNTGGSGVQAIPIYNKFICQAIKLNPKYLSMIIPARWYSAGFGLESFRSIMLNDKSLRIIHDYTEAEDCFSGVQIKGGVCYFLWAKDDKGDCLVYNHMKGDVDTPLLRPLLENKLDIFIRYNKAIPILHKIWDVSRYDNTDSTIDCLISSQKPFGIGTKINGQKIKNDPSQVTLYGNQGKTFINRDVIKSSFNCINKFKVFIPAAGSGSDTFPHMILGKPFIGCPGSVCSETYIYIGPFNNKYECNNMISYISTKFFRFLVMLRKPTQHALKKVYSLVPMQDFTKYWTDDDLYKKYRLSQEEIDFIDSMIKPMDLSTDTED